MPEKATIRRDGNRWTITYPRYGFQGPTSTHHPTGKAALTAFNQRRVSGGCTLITERSTDW